jgi:hypothetical protein
MAERAHGTHAKYAVERCRCDECRRAQREYNRHRVRQMARPDGVWCPYVDAGPVREHVRWLADCGVGIKTISKLSGVAHGTLWKLVYGDRARGMAPSRRVRPATAEKVMAVMPHHAAGGQKVPAGPTWRLLEELIARGWSRSELARRLGCETPALQIHRTRVRASTARAVEALHAELIVIDIVPKKTRWGLRPTPVPKVPGPIRPPARVYSKDPRPFPLAPLAAALGLSDAAFCRLTGLNQTRAREGLTERQADDLATRLGLHPFQVWGDAWGVPA